MRKSNKKTQVKIDNDFNSNLHRKRIKPLNENQQKYIEAIENKTVIFGIGPAGSGKAQPMYSKVKVPNGWKTMGELQTGDIISTPDGKTAEVLNVYEQGIKDISRINFEDGSYADCCDDHLWKVYYYDWDTPRILSLKEIIRLKNIKEYSDRLYIELINSCSNNDMDLPVHPYVLGVILGDGCVSNNQIGLSSADEELIIKMESLINDYHIINKTSGKYDYKIIGKEYHKNIIRKELGKLNLLGKKSESKFIPDVYLESSYKQKIQLIQGLMDTDGTVGKGGCVQYCTVSSKLAEQMQYLIRSIGGLCKIATKIPHFTYNGIKKTGQLAYILNIRHKNPKILFSLTRKLNRLKDKNQYSDRLKKRIKSIESIGKHNCRCILINSSEHLYITDNFIVTHNTFCAVAIAVKMLFEQKISKILIARPFVDCGESLGHLPGTIQEKSEPYLIPILDALSEFFDSKEIEELIENKIVEICPIAYCRGRNFKNCVAVIDEAENMSSRQLLMILTRIADNCTMIINGDVTQTDLPQKGMKLNPLYQCYNKLRDIDEIAIIEFDKNDIVRSEIISKILDRLEEKTK